MPGLPSLRAALRQRRQHRAFRIAPPALDDVLAALPAAIPGSQSPAPTSLDEQALGELATNLWRAQRKLAEAQRSGSAQSRQAGRYLRTCRDALQHTGIRVQDHDGDPFHPGRALEALAFEEDPSLTAETVRETVRPTVYLHDRRIQMGQVIVGCPATKSAQLRESHA